MGETLPVPSFTGADAFATANVSFVSNVPISVGVGFPEQPPEGDRLVVNGYVAGRLIDAPSEQINGSNIGEGGEKPRIRLMWLHGIWRLRGGSIDAA